jgi:hypothetical protein
MLAVPITCCFSLYLFFTLFALAVIVADSLGLALGIAHSCRHSLGHALSRGLAARVQFRN